MIVDWQGFTARVIGNLLLPGKELGFLILCLVVQYKTPNRADRSVSMPASQQNELLRLIEYKPESFVLFAAKYF
jgi:hypothetical protein